MKILIFIFSLLFVSCQSNIDKQIPVVQNDTTDIETGINTDNLCLD